MSRVASIQLTDTIHMRQFINKLHERDFIINITDVCVCSLSQEQWGELELELEPSEEDLPVLGIRGAALRRLPPGSACLAALCSASRQLCCSACL